MAKIFLKLIVPVISLILNVYSESELTDIDNEQPIDFPYERRELYGKPDPKVGDRLKITNLTSINAEEVGSYLEGDMLMPVPKGPRGRNGLRDGIYRWPNAVVPIEIRGPFSKSDKNVINSAIDTYHKNTCVHFKQHEREKDYIIVQNTPTGCWANVGRTDGGQVVNLQSPGCTTKIGTVQHEFMHALGFLHEQNREDRDAFVTINWNNIASSSQNNFKLASHGSTSSFNVPYDYGSIMHYSPFSFAVNSNQPTILSKDSKFTGKMGQRNGFSTSDIKKIWKMYKCSKTSSAGGSKPSKLNAVENLGTFLTNFLGIGDEEEMQGNTQT